MLIMLLSLLIATQSAVVALTRSGVFGTVVERGSTLSYGGAIDLGALCSESVSVSVSVVERSLLCLVFGACDWQMRVHPRIKFRGSTPAEADRMKHRP